MARRKRLTLSDLPTSELSGSGDAPLVPVLETKAMSFTAPPIARVAAEASASAALGDLAAAWHEARDSGRLIQALPLTSIDEGWLVRDRLTLDTEEMADLVASLRERGQQVPIEVVAQEGGRYGLISGWRRVRALKVLAEERGLSDSATVLAILRRPAGAADAYRAMVEENEIRAGLSYYERARVAARAAETGAFADARTAIAALFAAGSRAKRSKIGSFMTLVEKLDDRLRFAWAIPERLGLRLARSLEDDPEFRERLRDRLRKARPASAEAEMEFLARSLEQRPGADQDDTAVSAQVDSQPPRPSPDLPGVSSPTVAPRPAPTVAKTEAEEVGPGIWLQAEGLASDLRLTLSGKGVNDRLRAQLVVWLQTLD
jgi:ParB family transcriptional regulator, chromosome partitioning protein